MVTTPQLVATDDVRRALRLLLEVGVPVAGVVENMSCFVAPDTGRRYHPFGEGGGRALARRYGVPFLGELPLDPAIGAAGDAGTPIAAVGDEAQRALFASLAEQLWMALETPGPPRRAGAPPSPPPRPLAGEGPGPAPAESHPQPTRSANDQDRAGPPAAHGIGARPS
jgi:ATP-binding protein involved in chromosome partitioning